MTREEAKEYWLFRYANAKDYNDQNWDAQERREHRDYVEALLMAIEALSADTVEVVRCKDCKHYSVEGKTTQFGWCNALEMPTDEQRFCADGERKGGDDE